MIKIYLTGFARPMALIGKFMFEDERHIVIDDGGIVKKIPHDRVFYTEWLPSDMLETPPPDSSTAPFINHTPKIEDKLPSPEGLAGPEDKRAMLESLKRSLFASTPASISQVHQVDPIGADEDIVPMGPVSSGTGDELEVVFESPEGHSEQIILALAPGIVEPSGITPRMAKEIFASNEVRAALNGKFLAGPPTRIGNRIVYKIKDDVAPSASYGGIGDLLKSFSGGGKLPNTISAPMPSPWGGDSPPRLDLGNEEDSEDK